MDAFRSSAFESRSSPRTAARRTCLRPGSYLAFAEDVETSTTGDEEVFSNIDIGADGAMATQVFDFVSLSGGKEGNRGLEAWQLVKSDNGWKIVSLIYSNQLPP